MKKYLCGIVMLCLWGSGFARQDNGNTGLTIGSVLPEIILNQVINNSQSTISTGDYKGKLLILDFWATWCSPCVALMPKMDSLQQQFKEQLQILPVTYQSAAEVQQLLKKASRLKKLSLPLVTGDNTLRNLFPHQELPHYVWINENGKVIAITGYGPVNADTIRKMLNNTTSTSLKIKKDIIKRFNREVPLLFQDAGFTEKDVQFQSLLTGFKEGLPARMDVIRGSNGKIKKITLLNAWIKFLFPLAWSSDTLFFDRKRVIVEVKEPEKVINYSEGDEFKAWLKNNSWCYELVVPENFPVDVHQVMREDLKRYFPQYTGSVETRQLPCLVLERTSGADKLQSKGGAAGHSFDAYGAKMTNIKIGVLVSQLNFYLQHLDIVVIDGTGYTGLVDMELNGSLTNVDSIRQALKAYDLDLVKKEHPVKVLVIKDTR